ncbi:SseB family protein [Kocuria sp. cx-455]|uniref:SseB family protein n=1 Tax=Kocuria sp. cx-455 TaxID=2771377 RepID=UPI00168314D9|nr:SseB family protein [Kocuria sp. cx-455]MBD2765364.1 SseB family protein [Kocuria sp. cx-455]
MPDGSSSPHLPAHIAAQLRSAGGAQDTGGQAWEGRNLGEGTSHTHLFPDDDGASAPAVASALTAWRGGHASETAVIAALPGSRVFVPIVAEVSHSQITDHGLVSDKEADMALVSLRTADGRKALPVFTAVDELSAWNPDARPVAVDIRRAALSAVQDGSDLLVVNPASDPAFVVRRPAMWCIAKDTPWTPSYADLAVDDAVLRAALGMDGIVSARTEPGSGIHGRRSDGVMLDGGATGPELVIVLQLTPGLTREKVQATIDLYQQKLATEPIMAENVDSLGLRLTA